MRGTYFLWEFSIFTEHKGIVQFNSREYSLNVAKNAFVSVTKGCGFQVLMKIILSTSKPAPRERIR